MLWTVSSSVLPFSWLQNFPASESFPMSKFFALGNTVLTNHDWVLKFIQCFPESIEIINECGDLHWHIFLMDHVSEIINLEYDILSILHFAEFGFLFFWRWLHLYFWEQFHGSFPLLCCFCSIFIKICCSQKMIWWLLSFFFPFLKDFGQYSF